MNNAKTVSIAILIILLFVIAVGIGYAVAMLDSEPLPEILQSIPEVGSGVEADLTPGAPVPSDSGPEVNKVETQELKQAPTSE